MQYQPCQREAKDGRDMDEASVGLGLVEWGGVVCYGVCHRVVRKKLVGVDTKELLLGETAIVLETLTEGTGQRVALHLPELRYPDAGGIHLQGCSHRGEKGSISLTGLKTMTLLRAMRSIVSGPRSSSDLWNIA